MIQRMLTSALLAGFAAGLLAALLHFAFVQKLILLGEQYETGALVHFGGVAAPAGEDHDHAAMTAEEMAAMTSEAGGEAAADPEAAGHEHHHHEPGAEGEGASRNALTSLFFGVVYVAYGLILSLIHI